MNMKKDNILNYLILVRPSNWIKNFIIFLPIFFGGKISDISLIENTIIAFISFSFMASSIYILNDYMDLAYDRSHPFKKHRPMASGKVPIIHAMFIALVLLIFGLWLILQLSISAFYFCITYVVIMFLYCLIFRKLALVDIGIIAIGFVIRLFVGSSVTGIPNSMWIIIMIFLVALFITLAKRRDDLINPDINNLKSRESINGYSLSLVDNLIIVLVPIIIVSYILYCTAGENLSRIGENLYLTALFVIFGFMRYLQLIYNYNLGGDPINIFFTDSGIQKILFLWLVSFTWILYF